MVTIAAYDFDSHVEWAGFIEDEPVFATVEGNIHFPIRSGQTIRAHDGLLCAAPSRDQKRLLTGGEDGRIVATDINGTTYELANKQRKWIDVVACGPDGAVAFASGRSAWLLTSDGQEVEYSHERAIEGVTFAPKGLRIACARYNGVTLNWAVGSAKPVELDWDGAHTSVVFSPDGKYIVTTMAENALHGWRLNDKKSGDGKHMRMSGYPAKPKSLSWSPKGKWLASSGAQSAVCWPFFGKDGPMGKEPKELGTRGDAMVTQVACHPSEDVVAIGYSDGMIMAVKIEDAADVLFRRPVKAAISSMNWDNQGNRLAFGSEDGEAGTINI